MASSVIVSVPAYFAARRYNTTAQSFASGAFTTIIFNDELSDTQNQYNPTTGIFTCAVPGRYQFNTTVRLSVVGGANINFALVEIRRNALIVRGQESVFLGASVAFSQGYSAELNIGDTIQVKVYATSANGANILVDPISTDLELAHFSGFKVD